MLGDQSSIAKKIILMLINEDKKFRRLNPYNFHKISQKCIKKPFTIKNKTFKNIQ